MSLDNFLPKKWFDTDKRGSIASTETIADFLQGVFNQILRPKNLQVLDKLTEEIRLNFAVDADLKFEELVKLPYLIAVIEGLLVLLETCHKAEIPLWTK